MMITTVDELDTLINEKSKDRTWGRIVGFYRKLRSRELKVTEKLKILHSVVSNLEKRGYQVEEKVVADLILYKPSSS
jgi:hypothetical protein